jgi:cytochrome c biogenesis protein CcmG, thiol:disulfide interchange protein DsbE
VSNRPKKTTLSSERVRQAQNASAGRARLWWIVGAVVLVVGIAAIIAISVGGSDDAPGGGESASGGTIVPSGNQSNGPVEVTGTPLPQGPATGSDPAIGQPAPMLTGQSFDGSTVTIADDGSPKVVLFLAHWCPHCQAEVPRLVEWLEDNGLPADVELFAVATGTDSGRPNYPPGAWLRKEQWSVPTMLDDDESTAAEAYGLSSYPYFVVVGADGNVVERTSGEISTEQWEALLDAARTGQATGAAGAGDQSSPVG